MRQGFELSDRSHQNLVGQNHQKRALSPYAARFSAVGQVREGEYSLESEKFSFRTNDPTIIATLQSKAQNNEMSTYINEALRFYRDNASELTEIKQTLILIKEMISKGGMTEKRQTDTEEEKEIALDITSELFMNSLEIFG